MEMLINGTSIPPISGKILFGFRNKISSFSKCESEWNKLSYSEKIEYNSDSLLIKKKLNNIKPLQFWRRSILNDVSTNMMFYFFNYQTQISLHPYLSEAEIVEKCNFKLNQIKYDKEVMSLIRDNIDKLAVHKQ